MEDIERIHPNREPVFVETQKFMEWLYDQTYNKWGVPIQDQDWRNGRQMSPYVAQVKVVETVRRFVNNLPGLD